DGGYTREEIYKLIAGHGGLMAYFNTNSAIDVEKMIEAGDEHAKLVYEAMAYNIAKNIGAMAAVLCGEVTAVIITGGMAYSKMLSEYLKEHSAFIAPVFVYPGEGELSALAAGAVRVLSGEEQPKEYLG
ncbi:MAG: butyrate kinase, partial [Clostridia bacterium]|nr:butyrate kinase [Clostridia bacterium]